MTVSYIMLAQSDNILSKSPLGCFSDTLLQTLLPGTADRRYGLVKRALAKEDLIQLRRGLYCLGEKHRLHALNYFALAQLIYGPSYISFESALAYHGWIPESVPTITAASCKRARRFETPLGLFTYIRIPVEPFFVSVERLEENKQVYFMAQPWKALADYVYAFKKDWRGLHPLVKSLRIEEDLLQAASRQELETLQTAYRSRRVQRFLRGVQKDLKL